MAEGFRGLPDETDGRGTGGRSGERDSSLGKLRICSSEAANKNVYLLLLLLGAILK